MKAVFLGVVLAAAAMGAGAQAVPHADQLRPYLQVKTVQGDEFTVRAFFSPSCSYSKEYLGFFNNLRRTVPAATQFEFTPVINKGDGMAYALSFLAVKRYYPSYVPNYVEASLRGTQDLGMSPSNWAAIERFGQAAQLPVSLTKIVADNLTVLRADLDQALLVQSSLKITNTPSVSVAGTYIVTPEFTAGNSAQFSSLVNALISMVSDRR